MVQLNVSLPRKKIQLLKLKKQQKSEARVGESRLNLIDCNLFSFYYSTTKCRVYFSFINLQLKLFLFVVYKQISLSRGLPINVAANCRYKTIPCPIKDNHFTYSFMILTLIKVNAFKPFPKV